MKASATLLIPVVFLLGAAGAEAEVVSRTTALDGISHIQLRGYAVMTIRQGDKEFVKLSADDDLIDNVDVNVSGDTLVLGQKRERKGFFHWDDDDKIVFEVQVKDLSSFESSGASKVTFEPFTVSGDFELANNGAGKIDLETITADRVEIDSDGAGEIALDAVKAKRVYSTNNGAGHLTFDNVDADSLEITVNGAGEVTVRGDGEVNELKVTIHGVGEVSALDTVAQQAKVEIYGAGSVLVNAQQTLDAGIYGAGSVRYRGDPEVAQTVNGAGAVKTYR